ncbi:PIN domain-containing protein [Gloeocapsa sp. PCC 73106]|uniref:type II toxin-antitoxin system VapC family toxin n=1 Tax=Gloeocapsa sp. PCC 73106 TaxID=102232 RepID=UPI0002ACC1F6|nr:PIN domain-containing protein [Gloeocapsa sp. PCC 73106]ELR99459.1 putative nucleic acid-binding protein [Gloeocapsa sp. PCC 73106]
MKLVDSLQGISRLFLDTAPVIYYVERHRIYFPLVDPIFDLIIDGAIEAVTSPITLAECLVIPYRQNSVDIEQKFIDVILGGENTSCFLIDEDVGQQAAKIRANHNLALPDAFQIAIAIQSGCDAILTNDQELKRVTELSILVLSELEL